MMILLFFLLRDKRSAADQAAVFMSVGVEYSGVDEGKYNIPIQKQ